MLDAVIEWCARRPWLVIVLTGALVLIGWRSMHLVPLDAIPDLSDPQVIIYTEWPGRSPDLVEDQVTYPLVSSMLSSPRVSVVRGISDYGFSYVHVIFDEGTDVYWARSRVLEALSRMGAALPEGVIPSLGPDASGVGWAFEYAVVDRSGRHDLAQLRSFNDWYLRYWLASVPGVAEIAAIGGFVRQYQVSVDPQRLAAAGLSITDVADAVRRSNGEVGGRVIEMSGREYIVRGRGYLRSAADLEAVPLGSDLGGAPILLGAMASIAVGPDMRRGIAELNGEGEVTGGIVVVRQGENVLDVIDRVKARLEETKAGLPEGIEVVTTYDRSGLIRDSIATLRTTLLEELLIVSLVIFLFLRHPPSAIIPIVTIPVAIILSFIVMHALGVSSNIMSLAGIALAMGALVDAAIVVVEQTHVKLAAWEAAGRPGDHRRVIIDAIKEVGGPSFFSLLVIAVAFIPVFALQGQEGRLFRPLALTKNTAMFVAAILTITLDPALRIVLTRVDPIRFLPRWFSATSGDDNDPISRRLMRVYEPMLAWALRHRAIVIGAALAAMAATIPIYFSLGREFMPPLNEGSILYMPVTLPGIGVTEATRYLQIQDRLIMKVPEVRSVFGKIGKAETSTDPAPLSMVETTIVLRPVDEWRKVPVERWHSGWAPAPLRRVLGLAWPEQRRLSWDELIAELDRTVQIPSFANAWLYPVKTRIDMVTTGMRTPVGVKVLGPDLATIERVGEELERVLRGVPGTRSAFFERVAGGSYLDIETDRVAAARYGISVADVNEVVETALGGRTVTTIVEGRERVGVSVRVGRDFREDPDDVGRLLVRSPSGTFVPLADLSRITIRSGPPMIRNEEGFRAGYVHVDVVDRDLGGYVDEAKRAVAAGIHLPAGYQIAWSGQYEYMQRARERLALLVPITLLVIILLLYLNTGSLVETSIVLLAVPFSAIGAMLLLWLLDYNLSVAVWVGVIALMGVDAETGVFMLLYLNLAWKKAKADGKPHDEATLREAIMEGAVKRLRPKLMTVAVMLAALLPILWSTGTGSDVMRRIAAPMIGGIVTSFALELLVYPVIYELWKRRELKATRRGGGTSIGGSPGSGG